MARAYSLDLRARVVAAVDAGLARAEVMRRFGVSRSTVRRLVRRRESQGGSLAPRAGRPGPAGLLADPAAKAMLTARLTADGDARLEDQRRPWQAAGRPAVSAATMWRAGRALGWRQYKKSGSPPPASVTREARARWRQANADLKAADLVCVDESGANLALAPLYGWAPAGQRASGQAPCNRGRNTAPLAAMTQEGLLASMTVEKARPTRPSS